MDVISGHQQETRYECGMWHDAINRANIAVLSILVVSRPNRKDGLHDTCNKNHWLRQNSLFTGFPMQMLALIPPWLRSVCRCAFFFVLILLLGHGHAENATWASNSNRSPGVKIRPQDEIWLVSTRRLAGSQPSTRQPNVWEFRDQWEAATAKDFVAKDTTTALNLFWVHGNHVDANMAVRRGFAVYRELVRDAPTSPIRFVVWSWPSKKLWRPMRDAKLKAARADLEGYYLARFTSQMDSHSQMAMMGFSFGPRIITGALHVINNGKLRSSREATFSTTRRQNVRVVLLAPAMHHNWLLPNSYHGRAGDMMERLLLFKNSCDRALKLYPLMFAHHSPTAMGRKGVVFKAEDRGLVKRVQQFDVADSVGSSHSYSDYVKSPEIMSRIRDFIFLPVPTDVGKLSSHPSLGQIRVESPVLSAK